jgi:serine-type D-Ala-D-Ala carboxypeptidase/endopeptidase
MKQTLFFLLFSTTLLAQNNSKAIWKMVDNMLYREAEIDFKKVPSLAIGIVMQDSTYFRSFGSLQFGAEKGKEILPTDSTAYELGAFTKVFTATILAQAVTEGKIKLEDTVQNYLPKGYKIPNFKGKPIRFLDLATHTAGLPKYPYNIGQSEVEANNLFKNYTTTEEKEFLAFYRLRQAPFEKYEYSHLGYEILAHALVQIYGATSFEALLQDKILKPLQMTASGIAINPKNLAQGYSRSGKPVQAWTMASFQGSMGAKSTMRDLLKFMRLQMDTPTTWKTAIALTQTAQHAADKRTIKVALGWHSVTVLKKYPPILVHTGITDGHRMYFAFVPETRTGVIILSNSEEPMNALGPLILQMLNYNWKRK